MTASEGLRSRWPCREEAPHLHDNTNTQTQWIVVFLFIPPRELTTQWNNRRPGDERKRRGVTTSKSSSAPQMKKRKTHTQFHWPGSENTALEWQASSSSRIRLNTDPWRVHHTLWEGRSRTITTASGDFIVTIILTLKTTQSIFSPGYRTGPR